MSYESEQYIPPKDQKELVLSWLRRARESQMAHYEMADRLSKKVKWLGVPVIILTVLVGASAFASIVEEIIPV
jgi:hypothetical protein